MILDINGDPVSSFSFSMESSQVVTFKIKILCLLGFILKSGESSNATIEGKLESDISYVDLVSTGIPLDAFADTYQTFDIRLTAISTVTEIFDAFKIYLE